MTYFTDPVPPGHGEHQNPREGQWPQEEPSRDYAVVVVLPDGNPEVDSRWANLSEALKERDKVVGELREGGHIRFFVGVRDDDDPERGWLSEEDE